MSTAGVCPPPGLDEAALRRPEFRGDVPVVLDDGQTWHLPRPRICYRLAPTSAGGKGLRRMPEARGEYQAALDALEDAGEGEDEGAEERYVVGMLRLACAVVRLNYDLDDDQVASLVSWVPGERDGALDKILEVAYGRGPKPTDAGDAAA